MFQVPLSKWQQKDFVFKYFYNAATKTTTTTPTTKKEMRGKIKKNQIKRVELSRVLR